jgi:sulfate adenylyltransferase
MLQKTPCNRNVICPHKKQRCKCDKCQDKDVQPKSENIVWDKGIVSREDREAVFGQRGATLWFTGLSGSGKSAVAACVEKALVERKVATYRLDGDNLRFGLNSDLGFQKEDRFENIRRVGEVAKLFSDAGMVVLTSFISPYEISRCTAKAVHEAANIPFFEIHMDCPLEVAESRDPKGLYKKARQGLISDFTGVSAPYETPKNPALVLKSDQQSIEECAHQVLSFLERHGFFEPPKPRIVTPIPAHGVAKVTTEADAGLVDLMDLHLSEEEATSREASLVDSATHSWSLDHRQACDAELLMNGGLSPLTGFMTEAEAEAVVANGRLPDGTLFPMPVTLAVDDPTISVGSRVLLTYTPVTAPTVTGSANGQQHVALLEVSSVWRPDKVATAAAVFGTTSLEHPGVASLAAASPVCVGGRLHGLQLPQRAIPCDTPRQLRARLPKGVPVVAFQCRNPIHRAHYEMLASVGRQIPGATVLVHPTCGPTQSGDINADTRFATYTALAAELAVTQGAADLEWAYLPYSMHLAGPRESVMHMILRRNYGATHFIVGRDMAGTKSTLTGQDFYGAFDAQQEALAAADELGMGVVPFRHLVYTRERGFVTSEEATQAGLTAMTLSGTEFRRRLRAGEEIPDWFSFQSVVCELQRQQAK